MLYATSRGGHDLGLPPTSTAKIVYHKLDISSDQSIDDLLSHIKKTHEDGEVGVLINNAAVEFDHKMYTAQNAKKTLDVNYRGTLNVCQKLIQSGLMPSGSRIVNLSSAFGSNLSPYSPEVQRRFRSSREDMTFDQLEELARQFEKAAEEGKEKEKGFGGRMRSYGFSKACVNAATAILAREHPDLVINCCCPGWVSTDMGNVVGRASKSPGRLFSIIEFIRRK